VGLSDGTLLIPALARPQQLYAYANPLDIIGMATAYAASIVRNPRFVDGNKRTGFCQHRVSGTEWHQFRPASSDQTSPFLMA
jgi:death on curing protein